MGVPTVIAEQETDRVQSVGAELQGLSFPDVQGVQLQDEEEQGEPFWSLHFASLHGTAYTLLLDNLTCVFVFQPMTVKEVFVKMLVQFSGLSLEKALLIVSAYPTPKL